MSVAEGFLAPITPDSLLEAVTGASCALPKTTGTMLRHGRMAQRAPSHNGRPGVAVPLLRLKVLPDLAQHGARPVLLQIVYLQHCKRPITPSCQAVIIHRPSRARKYLRKGESEEDLWR